MTTIEYTRVVVERTPILINARTNDPTVIYQNRFYPEFLNGFGNWFRPLGDIGFDDFDTAKRIAEEYLSRPFETEVLWTNRE